MRSITYAFLLLLGSAVAAEPRGTCSREEAIEAEQEAASLASWSALHDSFRRFRACDDGAIAEGYSDSVTTLLDTNWSSLQALANLSSSDPSFLDFVLKHIDLSVPTDRLKRISRQARSECPPGLAELCAKIASTAPAG